MRTVSGIDTPLADEHVLGTDPPLRPALPGIWRRRINPFTGRALSDRALSAEQAQRSGMQRLRGQSVSAGVIAGLDLLAEPGAVGALPRAAFVQILPGSGLTRSGEDVIVASPRRIALADLAVRARVDLLDRVAQERVRRLRAGPPPAAEPPLPEVSETVSPSPLPRRLGGAFGRLLEETGAALLPRVAVLVAEPITATILAGARDACSPDPRDDPYDDLRLIDGCRLVLDFWPAELRPPGTGQGYAMPPAGPAQRNLLAARIFAVERDMPPGAGHPWEGLGLPLALVGFTDDWRLAFVDRAAVVRMGGQPLPRTPLVPRSGNALLWQARVAQFVEHLGALPDLEPATLAEALRFLPPVGFLPASVVDLAPRVRRQRFFPAGFAVSAAPIPADQVDVAVRDAAAMVPFSMDIPDRVELLVPVPAAVYEPGLLERAAVDGAFAQAVDRYTRDRTEWLVRRELVRRRRDILTDAVTGQRAEWPVADLPASEALPYPATRAPVTCTRIRRLTGVSGMSPPTLTLTGAGSSLPLREGDLLYLWVRVVAPTATQRVSIDVRYRRRGSATLLQGTAIWGAAAGLPTNLQSLVRGPLPPTGRWTRLEVQASAAWSPSGETLVGAELDGITFGLGLQNAGTVEFGPVGRLSASGMEAVWLADDAPPGSTLVAVPTVAGGWPQAPAGSVAILAEPDLGTIEANGVRGSAAFRDFRARWPEPFLTGDLATLDELGIDGFIAEMGRRIQATNDAVDLGFTRTRADTYRLRQFMLGGNAASKLVTSPTLADLAVREESARGRSLDIAAFAKGAFRTDFRRDADDPLDTPPRPKEPQPIPPAPVAALLPELVRFSAYRVQATSVPGRTTMMATSSALMERLQPVMPVPATTAATLKASVSRLSISALRIETVGRGFSPADVRAQRPLPGLVERTTSVAERLASPPAMEALHYALAGKLAALASVGALIGDLAVASDHPRGVALGDLEMPGYAYVGPAPVPAVAGTVGDVLDSLRVPERASHYRDNDGVPSDAKATHEADLFSAAVRAIDNTVALWRMVEARVDVYERMVDDLRAVRETIAGQVAAIDARLRTIDVEVEEARHDLGVAAALLAEETARVQAVNARRSEVIARHVTAVVFRRPREAERSAAAPTLPAVAALAPSPVAACLEDHPGVPEEINDLVALFRHAPVAWFPAVARRLELLDRIDAARGALLAARRLVALPPPPPPTLPAGAPRLLGAVFTAMTATRTALEPRRIAALQLDLGAVAMLDLSSARRLVAQRASLGDLVAGEHNRPALAREAAAEIEGIGRIAACLHAAFGEAPPAIRLGWAEILSGFDAAAAMDDLAGLPRWSELPIALRRTQQGLVDWLYGRVHGEVAEARAAMDMLVRVCLLMSAHAPTDRVIPARLVSPAPARPGTRIELALTAAAVRVGMAVLVRADDGTVAATAIVEDLAEGVARARILRVPVAGVTLAAGLRIELTDRVP